jgi:hypothetical protein
MMEGVLLRDAVSPASLKDVSELEYLCAEPCLLEALPPEQRPRRLIPMISAYLGSKKQPMKEAELENARSLGAREVLYYFDSMNVRHGYFDRYRAEIEGLGQWSDRLEPIVHFPYFHFSGEELEVVLPALKRGCFPVMIGLEEGVQAETQFGAILEALAARLAGQPLYGLFPGKKLLRSHRAMLAKLGFLGGAYYL